MLPKHGLRFGSGTKHIIRMNNKFELPKLVFKLFLVHFLFLETQCTATLVAASVQNRSQVLN